MIPRHLLLFPLMLVFITASDPYFGTVLSFKKVPANAESDVRDYPWKSTKVFDSYLSDHDDRVDDAFQITRYYEPMVRFWFFIYTQFESSQVVFHDKNNMGLIYRVLDFSRLQKKGLPRNTLYVLQEKLSAEKLDEMRKDLKTLANNPFSLEPHLRPYLEAIRESGVPIPVGADARKKFFRSLADNLRTQTGQKNFIRDGIRRSLPYQKFLTRYFKAKKLPTELLAIPFLESSFNPSAQSKVNALGAWQFMPLIASYFVPKRNKDIDYRFNVGVSSISAAFLMEENFRILKSWDLAVTAYNSGTKHLLKTKRELASTSINLEKVIKHSDSKHFGFASKNFYTEFLALAHTLAYQDEIFPSLEALDRSDVEDELHFYLAKCSVPLSKTLDSKIMDEIDFHNHHLIGFGKPINRGVVVSSKSELPRSKFLKLDFNQILKAKPIHWEKYLKNQSCSTR